MYQDYDSDSDVPEELKQDYVDEQTGDAPLKRSVVSQTVLRRSEVTQDMTCEVTVVNPRVHQIDQTVSGVLCEIEVVLLPTWHFARFIFAFKKEYLEVDLSAQMHTHICKGQHTHTVEGLRKVSVFPCSVPALLTQYEESLAAKPREVVLPRCL